MSSGDLCKSCKRGKLRPFQLSATEAIIKCSNTECDSYLDFLPQENIVATTAGSTSTSSSRALSRCASPDSPALSQYSSTDLEVADLYKPQIHATNSQKLGSCASQAFAPSKFPSSCHAPKSALPSVAKSALPSVAKSAYSVAEAERCNIDLSTASLDDVDFFLDSLFSDIPSPKPSLPNSNLARGLPSHCSAFSQVPSVSEQRENFSIESETKNDLSFFAGKKCKNKVEGIYDKFSEVVGCSIASGSCRNSSVHDLIMLDENQFLSPSGSVVSEDSGYNDEIPTAVAVSGSGTRGGQAETKTTNSSMPTPVPQLGRETVTVVVTQASSLAASQSSCPHVQGSERIAFLSAPESYSLLASPANTLFELHPKEPGSEPSPINISKSTDRSSNPDTIPLSAALMVVPGSIKDSEHLSHLHLKPSCFQSTEEVFRDEKTDSRTILSYAQLSLTNFFTIFEQNLSTAISKGTNHEINACPINSSGPIDSNKTIEYPKHLLVGEVSSPISEECLIEQSNSGGEPSTLAAEQHSSDRLRPTQRQSLVRGRPPKRKYKKRAFNNSNIVLNESVDCVLSVRQQYVVTNSPNPLVNNVLPTAIDDHSCAIPAVISGVPVASITAPGEEPLTDTQIPSVPSSDGALDHKTRRKYNAKRKNPEELPAPRKSARHQANPVESSRDTSLVRSNHNITESQMVSNSSVVLPPSTLAHVRPSLAALLPPLPHHGHKHRCDGSRSNKRLKPSQPFRHLASNVNADPWAFPVILLDQLDIEVVVQGRPRQFTTTHPIPKTESPTQSTNVCVSSCDSRVNGIADGAFSKSNHTFDVLTSVAAQMCRNSENFNVNKSTSNLSDLEPCLVETPSELSLESARKGDLDEPSGPVSVLSSNPFVTMTVLSSQSSSHNNSFSNNPSSVRVPSCHAASNLVSASRCSPTGGSHLSNPKPLPLRVPLRQASAHQPVLAVAPLDRSIALSNHDSPSPISEPIDAGGKVSNGFICVNKPNDGDLKLSEAISYNDKRNSNINLLQKFVDCQTEDTTVQLQSFQLPLHKHRQSIGMHPSSNFKPVTTNVDEIAESTVNLAMVKQEPGLSQLHPQVVHTFPSLQSFPAVCSIPHGQPIVNGSHEPQYVVIQGQVYQVVQQAVHNPNPIIQVPTAGIIDSSQSINKTSASQVSVLQVQPPSAVNYPLQQYYIQQPLAPHQQPFSQQEYVAMHPPVRVPPGMISSPQPSPVAQAVQQPGQPAVFCQAGPHSRPHATLSSVALDTSASCASSLMTFVPETSVGQRSLPQSSSTSSRNKSHTSQLSVTSTCGVLETAAVSNCNQMSTAGDSGEINLANFLSNNLHLQSVHNCNVKYVMSPGDTSTELVPSRKNNNILRSLSNSTPMNKLPHKYEQSFPFQSSYAKTRSSTPCFSIPPIPVSSVDLPFLPSDSTEHVVFCSQLPLSSHPPSPESSPASPKNFPLLGTSPESSPTVDEVSFDSPSSQMPHTYDLPTSPNAFPLDDSFINPCVKVLNYSSSPSASMQLVLSDNESCSELTANFTDACMQNYVPFHVGNFDPFSKGKLLEIDEEYSVACGNVSSKFALTRAHSPMDFAPVPESPQFSAAFPNTAQYNSQNSNPSPLHSRYSNVHTAASTTIPSCSFQMTAADCSSDVDLLVSNNFLHTVHGKSAKKSSGACTSANALISSKCMTTVPVASPFKSVFSGQCSAVLSQPCKTVNSLSMPKVSSEVQATLHPNSNYYQSNMASESSFLLDSCVELIAVPLEGLQCAQCNTDCWNRHALQLTNAAQLPNMIEVSDLCSSNFLDQVYCARTGSSSVQMIETSEEDISLQTTPGIEDCTYNFDSLTNLDPILTFSALAKTIDTPKYQKRKVRSVRVYSHKKPVVSYSRSQLSSEAVANKHFGECLKEGSSSVAAEEHTGECLKHVSCQNRSLKEKNRCTTSVLVVAGRTSVSSDGSKTLVEEKRSCGTSIRCTSSKVNEMGDGTSARDCSESVDQFQVESCISVFNVHNISSSISCSVGEETDRLSYHLLETSSKKQRKPLLPSKFTSFDCESVTEPAFNKKTLLRQSIGETRACVPHAAGRAARINTIGVELASCAYKPLGKNESCTKNDKSNPLLSKLTCVSNGPATRKSSSLCLSASVCASNLGRSNLTLSNPAPFSTKSLTVATSSTSTTNRFSDERLTRPSYLIPPNYSADKRLGVTKRMIFKDLSRRPSISSDLVGSNSTILSAMQASHRSSPHIFNRLSDGAVDHSRKILGTKYISDNSVDLDDNKDSFQATPSSNSNEQSFSSCAEVNIIKTNQSRSDSLSFSDAALLGIEPYHKSSAFRTENLGPSVIGDKDKLSISNEINKSGLLPSLDISRSKQTVINSNNPHLTALHGYPEKSSKTLSNGMALKTIDAIPPSSLAYLTVAKYMKKVPGRNVENFDKADLADEPLPYDRAKNASTSVSLRQPSELPVQLFPDTSNWWGSRQQAASDEVFIASSLLKGSEPVTSEDEDAASESSLSRPGRPRSFTLVELPDDHHAYEELIASGYSVEKPEIKLPEGVKVLISKEKRICFKWKQRPEKNKVSTQPVRKKLKTDKDSPKKVKEVPLDCRKMAQEAVDNIVATRLPEDIPAMVIVSVKGKLFMYGSS